VHQLVAVRRVVRVARDDPRAADLAHALVRQAADMSVGYAGV
jgi:hypothetical protein